MPLAKVRDAIDDIRKGRMLILVDDEDRENEGDFCFAAVNCANKLTFELGDGLFDFAVRAISVEDRASPLHCSTESNADPVSGWHVLWVGSQ